MASASLRRQGARWRWFSVWFSASTMPPERLRPTADHVALTQSELREFDLFFQHYQHRLFGYLWRVTGEEQTAYDLSQETFVRAWQHFRTIKSYERPDAWLLRVATNLMLNQQRRGATPIGRAAPFDVITDPASSDPTVRLAERDLVQTVLACLAPRSRAALVLREVYGFSCAEVGVALGISRSAAKMVLLRARDEFRVRYQSEGGDRR